MAAALSDLHDDVLILSNYYAPEPTGSAPPIADLSYWAAEKGLAPSVITARPSYPERRVYQGYAEGQHDRAVERGVAVRRVPSIVPKSRNLPGRLLSELSFALSALGARDRRFKGVVCVCPSIFTVLIAPLFKKRGGRVVVIVHDIQSGLAKSLSFGAGAILLSGLRALEAFGLNRCDAAVALSEAMAGELRDLGVHRPITVIPPQVDVREITPGPLPIGAPVLLYSGNLGRKQGLDQVLALAQTLAVRGSGATVQIRGGGSERVELEADVSTMGLTNLRFVDLAPRSRISEAMAEATIHLVPQNPAGANFALPSKVFSIMAAQRPFVATAQPGTPLEIVTRVSGGGRCVAPNDPELFADVVEALLADPDQAQALGVSGRVYVEEHIDREVVCARIFDLLREPAH